jgi:GNAT superfamily N-acetyltransferase
MNEVTYRAAYRSEWDYCMDLAWRIFLKYDAPDYPREGIENFKEFVTDDVLKNMFHSGEYQLFVAVCEEKIIGIISLRDRNHISLLFVESEYHRQGVGAGLINTLTDYMRDEMGQTSVTVNASPYAVGFYHKVGFEDTDIQQLVSGILFTPMILYF